MVDGVETWYFKRSEPFKALFPHISYLSKSLGYLYAPELRRALKRNGSRSSTWFIRTCHSCTRCMPVEELRSKRESRFLFISAECTTPSG